VKRRDNILPAQQESILRNLFQLFDFDGSGAIDKEVRR